MMPLTLFMMQQIALSFCNNLIAKRMADQIHFISNIGGSPHHAHYQGEVFAFFFFSKKYQFWEDSLSLEFDFTSWSLSS